eukprot:437685_1
MKLPYKCTHTLYFLYLFCASLWIISSVGETLYPTDIVNGVLQCTSHETCAIDCTVGDWPCSDIDMICMDGYDCTVTCSNGACLRSTIQCPNGGRCDVIGNCPSSSTGTCLNSCQIYCPPSDHACNVNVVGAVVTPLRLYGGGGDLSFSGSPVNTNERSTIDCPTNKNCAVHCASTAHKSGLTSCNALIINATTSARLDLTGVSIIGGDVHCPRSDVRGNEGICNIEMSDAGGLTGTLIHAVEGYNDINLACADSTQCYNAANPPRISCTASDDATCLLTATNAAYTEWKCVNESSVCHDYWIPTYEPTVAPITVSPTTATRIPTAIPTATPTVVPTSGPTDYPSSGPTVDPSAIPTIAPTTSTATTLVTETSMNAYESTVGATVFGSGIDGVTPNVCVMLM